MTPNPDNRMSGEKNMSTNKQITYRRHDWLNLKTKSPVFGIQARVNGQWMNTFEGSKGSDVTLLFFDTEQERDAKLKELRKQSRPTS